MADTAAQVVAIVGPTAVGKSAVADELAFRLGSRVLSADAMQVYRGMDIGTAKMLPEECQAPLELVSFVEPSCAYSAALYQRDCRAAIDSSLVYGELPVLCGGTGLYVRAALDAMDFPSGKVEDDRRAKLNAMAESLGPEAMHRLLADKDPESAALIHPNNVRRVIRALEMFEDGESYARQKEGFSELVPVYQAAYYALSMSRERLYERINMRVDLMFDAGLLDEVAGLVDAGYGDALTSMQAIGYKEVIQFFNGELTLEEAKDLIKMRSRRYAKRQISWFKRDPRMVWLDMDECNTEAAVGRIMKDLELA